MQPYSSTGTVTAWKNSRFILSEGSDFHEVVNLSIAIHALLMCKLILLTVNEIATDVYEQVYKCQRFPI